MSKPHLQEGQRDDTGGKGKQKSRQELRLLCPAASSLHSTRGKVTSRSESLGVCSDEGKLGVALESLQGLRDLT